MARPTSGSQGDPDRFAEPDYPVPSSGGGDSTSPSRYSASVVTVVCVVADLPRRRMMRMAPTTAKMTMRAMIPSRAYPVFAGKPKIVLPELEGACTVTTTVFVTD